MVSGQPGVCSGMPVEAERPKIKLIDEEIYNADKAALADPVFQTLGEKRGLIGGENPR